MSGVIWNQGEMAPGTVTVEIAGVRLLKDRAVPENEAHLSPATWELVARWMSLHCTELGELLDRTKGVTPWERKPVHRCGENTPEQQAALDSTWGFGPDGWWYRRALPAVDGFPTALRECGGLMGVTEFWHPPYISAGQSWERDKEVRFMVCGASGYRAGYIPPQKGDDGKMVPGDDSGCIYGDGDNIPEEWKQPIADAINEVRAKWPDHTINFRD